MRLARLTILGALLTAACISSPPHESSFSAERLQRLEADVERLATRVAEMESRADPQETVDARRIRELEARLEIEDLKTKIRMKERDDRIRQYAQPVGGSFDALRCSSEDRWEQLNRRIEEIRLKEVR